MIHNYSFRLYSSTKNLLMFDTSASHQKKKAGRIIVFTNFFLFFHTCSIVVWNFCTRQLKKKAPFLGAYLLDIFLM